MRRALLASAAALALTLAAAGWPAHAYGGPRAAVVFLPSPPRAAKGIPMLERLSRLEGLTAFGYMSSVQGAYQPEQVLLDMGAGARVGGSLYDSDLPRRISLRPVGRGGAITGWEQISQRAESVPADVVPGTLAGSLGAAGLGVGYAGLAGRPNREALLAADRAGQVRRVELGGPATIGARALVLWDSHALLVARLPGGGVGRLAVRRILGARRAGDIVLVVQQPNVYARRLLAVGAGGLPGGTTLRSDSTRRDGLIVSTDVAPTVLERVGIPVPKAVSGKPIEAAGDASIEDLVDFRGRLAAIGPRRWTVVLAGLGGAVLLAVLAGGFGAGTARRVGRSGLIAAMWLPAVLLFTGAVAPSALMETIWVALLTALLTAATDRALAWPRALVPPAAVSIGAHLVDLALGSELTARSLLGPNPVLGARFFGIGNELEAALAVIALLGLGAALASAPERTRVWGFAVGGGALAFLLGWGRLGADVGAVITLGVGAATAAVAAAQRGSWRTRAAIVLGAPALGIALLAALDLATGGDAHFTRSVLRAGGLDELANVAQRRFELSYTSLGKGVIGPLVVIAAAALVLAVRWRRRLLTPLDGMAGLRAGIYGALGAVIAGALTNDSGPIIFLIGTTYLALAAAYVAAGPGVRPREPNSSIPHGHAARAAPAVAKMRDGEPR